MNIMVGVWRSPGLNAVHVSHSVFQNHRLMIFIKIVKTNQPTKATLRLSRGLGIKGESFRTVEVALWTPSSGPHHYPLTCVKPKD